MSLIFRKSSPGKNNYQIRECELSDIDDIPEKFLNKGLNLVDVNETEVVRHYTALSLKNFGVDNGMYPLGSCTMKYNPKINEKLASLSNFTNLHPLSDRTISQGALKVMYDLSDYLSEITGMNKFTLIPAAGSHGELTGVMIVKKYFENIGENRDTIIIPDSAHGTNPASVSMCGYKIKEVPSDKNGNVDLEILKTLIDENVAAMMLTSPNTLGLFDNNILEISKLLHDNGSLFYGDGANLNALIGKAKMGDMGFDMIHVNLHKSFSTPHGGGGPGSGPLGVTEGLKKYLPIPVVVKKDNQYLLKFDEPHSIGKIHSFYGNFLVMLKAYLYIRLLGNEGLKNISEIAVLNANYLMSKLKKIYNLPIDRVCMHEFVINDKNFPHGITTNEITKRLLDYGFHAPTVYFPLIIEGAMMIEPTETESKDTLDSFISTMIKIKDEAFNSPDLVKKSPQNAPVKRVDAVKAARNPILKWEE